MRNGINNKALFITALGVYFGLMLSGAAPSALAQRAAITRNFDVSDAINCYPEQGADADKAIEGFAAALLEIYRITSETLAKDTDRFEEGKSGFGAFITFSKKGGGWLTSPSIYNYGLIYYPLKVTPHLRALYDSVLPREEKHSLKFRVDFRFTQDDIWFETNLLADNPSNAERIARLYDESLFSRKETELSLKKSLIYSIMAISFDDKQVIIAAHLPRSSIDPLPNAN